MPEVMKIGSKLQTGAFTAPELANSPAIGKSFQDSFVESSQVFYISCHKWLYQRGEGVGLQPLLTKLLKDFTPNRKRVKQCCSKSVLLKKSELQ